MQGPQASIPDIVGDIQVKALYFPQEDPVERAGDLQSQHRGVIGQGGKSQAHFRGALIRLTLGVLSPGFDAIQAAGQETAGELPAVGDFGSIHRQHPLPDDAPGQIPAPFCPITTHDWQTEPGGLLS